MEYLKEQSGRMVNSRVVLGSIESFGIREIDVQRDYGFDTIKSLSDYIYRQIQTDNLMAEVKNIKQIEEEEKLSRKIIKLENLVKNQFLLAGEYIIGILHSAPIFIQVAAIVISGFSLWAYTQFTGVQATAVMLGVILGFVASAGFIQILGKQISFFWYREDWYLARVSILHIIKTYFKVMVILGVLGLVFNFLLSAYPVRMMGIAYVYGLLIGLLLLTLAPLYTIKYRWIISAVIVVGTVTSVLMFKYTALSIYYIHWINILICIFLSLGALHYIYIHKKGDSKEKFREAEPNRVMSVFENFEYFLYGTLVFVFFFTDRIVAWSSPAQHDLPFLIYYQQDYEIGMDLAILVFFLLAGALEYAISSFSRFVDYKQQILPIKEAVYFGKKAKSLYFKHLRVFGVSALLIVALLYLVITQPWGYQGAFGKPLSEIALRVTVLGGVGYFFLTIGLLNVLYLFTLNTCRSVVLNIVIALLVNLLLGVMCSRIISYDYSVIGMLSGALIFFILTTREVLKYFNNIEYYCYAAY